MKPILSTIFFLTTVWGMAQEWGGIHGQVVDLGAQDEPLMFSHITLESGAYKYTVQTNLHGNYHIDHLTPGNYTITFAYPGYDKKTITFEVGKNKSSKLNMGLKAKILSTQVMANLESKAGEPH